MKSINVLLIEDNEGDILLTTEVFEENKIINKIMVIRNGEEAISFFEGLTDKSETPHLVLLDINLPKMSGHDVLKYIKNNEKYRQIPVIMLSTSASEKDILLSNENQVNYYMTKPIDGAGFLNAITNIKDFWINIVSIPVN